MHIPKEVKIAENLDEDLKHYGGVKEVRWVASQTSALRSLLDNYEIAAGRDEVPAKARNNLAGVKTEKFLKMLHFMIDFTNMVTEVSKVFQL